MQQKIAIPMYVPSTDRPDVLALLKKYTNKRIKGIMSEYVPFRDGILIEDKRVDAVMKSTKIILPSGASNACIGMVMAVGPDVSSNIQIGMLVHYNQYADLKIELDTRTFIVANEFDVKGVINPNGSTSYYGKGTYATLTEEFKTEQADKLKDVDKKRNIIANRETLMKAKGKIVSYQGDRPSKKK